MRWPRRERDTDPSRRNVPRAIDDRDAPPLALVTKAFDRPSLVLGWTGNGVRSDARGRLQFVRHALERTMGPLGADEIVSAEAGKLLVLEALRYQSAEELVAWFASSLGERSTTKLEATTMRAVSAGEQVVVAYEPRSGRTRIVWPWGASTDIHDRDFMRSLWRSYFDASDQRELATQLTRWL